MTKLAQMSLKNDGGGDGGGLNRRRIHLREISGDSESPLETVGQDLRAARLRRGDEISQVSRALKIRKDHLEALENDRLEDLPGKTYAIGFVRSYARHLGLDSNQYVERYKQDISGRHEEQTREPAAIHQDESRLPHGWRVVAGIVAVLLLYGGYHLFWSGGETSQPVPPAPNLNPPKVAQAPKPQPVVVPQQTAIPSPAADTEDAPNGKVTPGGATAMPPPAAGARTPATQIAPMTTTAPVAQPSLQPKQPLAAVPAVAPSSTGNQVYGDVNRGARVVLRARGDTVITVKDANGNTLLNRTLRSGDVYQVPDQPGVSFATSNAGAVEIDLDGAPMGRAGQQSQVIGRQSLDPQSLVDRFNTH